MKKKIISILLACMIGGAFIAGCSKSDSKKSSSRQVKEHNDAVGEVLEEIEPYAMETTAANYKNNDLSMNYGDVEGDYYDEAPLESNANAVDPDQGTGNAPDTQADASKEMLVFRCTMSIDTLNFEESLTALKTKIQEYHGFVERENQSDGNNGNGRYLLEEEDKDYYYTATIRIPSAYYESFVSATEGIGTLRSKNSSVDNVATRYGTLKNDLEIYEAEYQRYLKQYNETEDEAIALEIQRELRNLSITISDIKTQMSMLESDVAYSYVTVTIHKVSEKQIKKEKEEVKEEDSFGTRLSKKAKQSWKDFLGFLEGILMALVGAWWGISLFLIAFLIIFFFIRHKVKKSKAKAEARRKELETQQAERRAAYEVAKEQAQKANEAKIQERIASQRATEAAAAADAQEAEVGKTTGEKEKE